MTMKAHKVNFELASDGMDKVNFDLVKVNFDLEEVKINLASDFKMRLASDFKMKLVEVKFNLASDGSRDV